MSRLTDLVPFLSGWPRRAAAVLCLFAAAASLLLGGHEHPGDQRVLVTTRALSAGATVASGDVRVILWPTDAPQSTAISNPQLVIGRRTALALARGTPVEASALLEPRLATALAAGNVAMTITLADANTLLQAGGYVDLYAHDADSSVLIEGKSIGPSTDSGPLASRVQILSVLPAPATRSENTNSTLVISINRTTATRLSSHAGATFLATLVAPP